MRRRSVRSQAGSAILTAMLTVTLVATLATSALWQQWRTSEIEAAERARLQSRWILGGALDWARLILREDAAQNAVDHLSEPWAVPLAEARLSTFLAVSQGESDTQDVPGIFLSGHIIDLQSRLNIGNLVQGGATDPLARIAFTRLFQQLGLDQNELAQLIKQLEAAQKAAASTGNTSNAGNTSALASRTNPNVATTASSSTSGALLPSNFDQLVWLGLSAATLDRLRPFVTFLPKPTPVNLNTAPAEVIFAVISDFDWSTAQRFVQQRNQLHLTSLNDVQQRSGSSKQIHLDNGLQSVNTRFFEVHASLRNDLGLTTEVSVIQRDGMETQVLSRLLTQ